jgi:hypothetical protein
MAKQASCRSQVSQDTSRCCCCCNWALPHPPIHPCSPPLSFPTPPSTLLARPRRLTDSAADQPGPSHLSGCWLLVATAGCTVQPKSHKVTPKVTVGEGSPTVLLAWSGLVCNGMASHAQNWAPISLSFLSLPILHVLRPCSPLFLLLCSGSALSYPVPSEPYIQDSSSLRRLGRLASPSAAPAPIPKLYFALRTPSCRILSAKHNPTQPNSTHAPTRTPTLTLIANLRYLP